MTINLFNVEEALTQEEQRQKRLEQALKWKLRPWNKVEPEPEEEEATQEGGEPQTAG